MSEDGKAGPPKSVVTSQITRLEKPVSLPTPMAKTGGMETAFLSFLQSLVVAASASQRVPAERRIFLTIAESAELSGLPVRFLRRLMRDGTLKAVRVGGGWRIPRTELESLGEKLAAVQAPDTRQELSEAEQRDLAMNKLRRQGLLPVPDAIPEVN
jgi:excisionase family DNA binding protein